MLSKPRPSSFIPINTLMWHMCKPSLIRGILETPLLSLGLPAYRHMRAIFFPPTALAWGVGRFASEGVRDG